MIHKTSSLDDVLTFRPLQYSGANGASFTRGPPIQNSNPQGPGSPPSFQPNQPNFDAPGAGPASPQWGNPSFPQESSVWQASGPPAPSSGPSLPPAAPNGDNWGGPGGNPEVNPGGHPGVSSGWNNDMAANGPESWTSQYSSEITYVDPNLSFHTVTVTELPTSQVPTVTSAAHDQPDTTGVSPTQLKISSEDLLTLAVREPYT